MNGGEYRTLVDNLNTSKNYTLPVYATAPGLISNECVADIMFVFGQALAGFFQMEASMLYCTAVKSIFSTAFVNMADVGGVYQRRTDTGRVPMGNFRIWEANPIQSAQNWILASTFGPSRPYSGRFGLSKGVSSFARRSAGQI